jgi:hypothetical protein
LSGKGRLQDSGRRYRVKQRFTISSSVPKDQQCQSSSELSIWPRSTSSTAREKSVICSLWAGVARVWVI